MPAGMGYSGKGKGRKPAASKGSALSAGRGRSSAMKSTRMAKPAGKTTKKRM